MSVHAVYEKQIQIPEKCKVTIEDRTVTVSGPMGTVSRSFMDSQTTIRLDGREFVASTTSKRKHDRAMVGTIVAHLRNMFDGVQHGYKYELKVVYSHFPMNIEVRGKELTIKNFIGERGVRKAHLIGDVKIQVAEDEITITGIDLEQVSQSAANIQSACKLRGKDRRVYLDGVYVIRKTVGGKTKSVV
ncbi:MAG: 50S ribosomal protein L6 [Candidatus Thorarchaeota archaeon]|nr:50S ribosomal protein L6 [Candidatus Thorarchaeota archaeon]